MTEREKELLYFLQAALDWIDAVPEDTQLPAMPGFDRDVVDNLIDDITTNKTVIITIKFMIIIII